MSKQGYDEVGKGDRETVNCPVCGRPMNSRVDNMEQKDIVSLWCIAPDHSVRVELHVEVKVIE